MGFLLRKLLSCSSVVSMLCYPSSVPALGWRRVLVLFEACFPFFFAPLPKDLPSETWRMKLPRDILGGSGR